MASNKKNETRTSSIPDPEIERVHNALALPKEPELGDVVDSEEDRATSPALEPTRAAAEEPPPRRRATVNYGRYVVTERCGTRMHDGKTYDAGQIVELTAAQAELLGKDVAAA